MEKKKCLISLTFHFYIILDIVFSDVSTCKLNTKWMKINVENISACIWTQFWILVSGRYYCWFDVKINKCPMCKVRWTHCKTVYCSLMLNGNVHICIKDRQKYNYGEIWKIDSETASRRKREWIPKNKKYQRNNAPPEYKGEFESLQ